MVDVSMSETFACARCGVDVELGDEAEALAELRRRFGTVDPADCSIVCDTCYAEVVG